MYMSHARARAAYIDTQHSLVHKSMHDDDRPTDGGGGGDSENGASTSRRTRAERATDKTHVYWHVRCIYALLTGKWRVGDLHT